MYDHLFILLKASWETIYMVFLASMLSIIFGLILGCYLALGGKSPHLRHKVVYNAVGLTVNGLRSLPFVILLILLIPFTHAMVGTSIGVNAAVIPLAIAAIPFYARVCENALASVPQGLLEAGNAMGVTRWQAIYKILLPESKPALIRGATLTIIALIGYSAMAGVVGGGGLGELAINSGYQRFDTQVMIETVVILLLFVQAIQMLSDKLVQTRRMHIIYFICIVLSLACVGYQLRPVWSPAATNTITVGVMSGWQEKVMQKAIEIAKNEYDLNIKLITFNDYVQPNISLENGSIDANIFQHLPFLQLQMRMKNLHLAPLAKTFVYPLGFYSQRYKLINLLPENACIGLPNDPSNLSRALLLLQQAGLIKLKTSSSALVAIADIAENQHHYKFITLAVAQLPRSLNDLDMAAITNDYLNVTGLTLNDALLKEDKRSAYANLIVVRKKDINKEIFKQLTWAMHSDAVIHETEKYFPDGAALPAWK